MSSLEFALSLQNADWEEELIHTVLESDEKGYQWKMLYRPHGTKARMQNRGGWHYATVKGDQFMYNGSPTTLRRFATTVAQSSRSAQVTCGSSVRRMRSGWLLRVCADHRGQGSNGRPGQSRTDLPTDSGLWSLVAS